ncbi:hypothetical protein [Pseudomonas sp. Gutcm_11s]|uniref:hypothetical protein n=1 Tax=Pseudomonas sp. Gutcm_11s TaxID=3026088 RepID=UPI0023612C8E|nr:hypothetical protein [Pseudomonas sp. Gutcm_11s]MDD0843732.1 hypothetical protein [Pseudomonas sp. Gutcm_11s]
MKQLRRVFLTLMLLPAAAAFAAGGSGEYELDWPVAGETLAYRSCGCGDACWVAQVRDTANGEAKATLSCDCEALFYALGGAEKQPLSESCEAINQSEHKAGQISDRLQQLLGQGR